MNAAMTATAMSVSMLVHGQDVCQQTGGIRAVSAGRRWRRALVLSTLRSGRQSCYSIVRTAITSVREAKDEADTDF
jgi:hypothetical protein